MDELISNCPVCGNTSFLPFLEVEDYFLSHEIFSIQECNSCRFKFVSPRPDTAVIGKYYQSDEYISHDAGHTDLLSSVYKLARVISISNKYKIVRKFASGGKLLDIGCGTGEFLKYCQAKGFEVLGVEPSDKARSFAQSKNMVHVFDQLESLSESDGTFNCITMWHVLEHIHNLNDLILNVSKRLRPDGVFVVAVPNSNSWDARYYKKYWAAYDVPRHLYHFTKETLQQLASKHGFEILKIYPQNLDAYYVSMLSEKYKSGQTNYVRSLLHGFWSNWYAKKPGIGHSSQVFLLSFKKG
jgi:2-polyprenyl-3-methyl-5-hydroxy-6-metoxy-1,4-benzoquinol methylase